MTSPDGVTWTLRAPPAADALWSVVWSTELTLLVATGNNGTILTSPDGINWTVRTSGVTGHLTGVGWGPTSGVFVAVGVNGADKDAIRSTDGITWTQCTNFVDDLLPWRVAWISESNILVVACVDSLQYTYDGDEWFGIELDNDGGYWFEICEIPEKDQVIMSGTRDGACLAGSSDGIHWPEAAVFTQAILYQSLIWSPDLEKVLALTGGVSTSIYLGSW
jgi:hypothetical protein